jgi:hypothetical protein
MSDEALADEIGEFGGTAKENGPPSLTARITSRGNETG